MWTHRLSGHATKFIGGTERGGENKREGGMQRECIPISRSQDGLFVSAPPSRVCCDVTQLMKEANAGSLSFQTLVYSK